jgi:hypothetical protein
VKFARFSDHNPVIVEMSNYWHRSWSKSIPSAGKKEQ